MKRGMRLIEVLWEDSCGYDVWERESEARGWANTGHEILSVGYEFERNRRRLVLVQSVAHNSNVNGQLKIPMVVIKRIRVLARAKGWP